MLSIERQPCPGNCVEPLAGTRDLMDRSANGGMNARNLVQAWGKILQGRVPMLSIEITRECPLRCPGCYAYGDDHLGAGAPNLRSVADYRDDELVRGVLWLVDKHRPLQVSLVGGEPLVRRREVSRILPELDRREIFTLVVTSGVIPIPRNWPQTRYITVAVSVDGLAPDHDERRAPAAYDRILRNIAGQQVNIHWTVVRKHVETPGYMDQYLTFWQARPEVHRIWLSVYTPQAGEQSAERLTAENRRQLSAFLLARQGHYSKFTTHPGLVRAFQRPPANPGECLFSQLSVNYTADLVTRVEPCVFGGQPECAECGCSISLAAEWIGSMQLVGPLRAEHVIRGSLAVGRTVNRLAGRGHELRWSQTPAPSSPDLVQIR